VTASPVLSRRSILVGLAAAAIGGGVAGCTSSPQTGDPLRPVGSGTASPDQNHPAETGGNRPASVFRVIYVRELPLVRPTDGGALDDRLAPVRHGAAF
jgi:hypothetical protein